MSHKILQSNEFLGRQEEQTIFYIECSSGKNIQKHSYYSTREEILLPAEIKFKVNGCRQSNHISVIHLKEIVQSSPFIQAAVSVSRNSFKYDFILFSFRLRKSQFNLLHLLVHLRISND